MTDGESDNGGALRYVLVGPNAGKTVKLSKGKYPFVKGVMEVNVSEDKREKYAGITRILARSYNAHPEGSKALDRAQAEWAAQNGGKNAGRQANNAAKAKASGAAAQGARPSEADVGSEGHAAEGGDGVGAGDGAELDESAKEIREALAGLDVGNDKHWTSTGLPNLKVLGELLGRGVSRTEIDAAYQGFNREAAAA